MSEFQHISPLLDGFTLGMPMSEHDGVRCCPAIKENSDKKYIVKIISIPASQTQMDAMLLAGAFKQPEDAMAYFKDMGEEVMREAQFLKDVARLDGFLSYEDWQMEPIQRKRLGYEVYLVGTYKRSLEKHVRKHPVTHLEAINLGLDLCTALNVCRQAGALYVDLKPTNIFVSDKNDYRIGDLGFIRLDALKYTPLPTKYRSRYSPPELYDPMVSVNLTADTYAVGMILYQLYNEGTLPFRDMAPEEGLPNPVHADYELAEIIMKAIHPDPEQRWQDPGAMGQALVSYMQRNTVNDEPITPYTPLDVEAQNVQIPREDSPKEETQEVPAVTTEAAEATTTDVLEAATDAEPALETLEEETSQPEPETTQVQEDTAAQEPVPETVEEEPNVISEEIVAEEAPSEEAEPSNTEPETDQPEIQQEEAADDSISDELSRIMSKADDLIAHEAPSGVVLPEIHDEPDPFAFAMEDNIEFEDLQVPFDPVMEVQEEKPSRRQQRQENNMRAWERKRKIKRFFGRLLVLLLLAAAAFAGFFYYQNVYLQTIHSITVDSARNQLTVNISTNADESLLTITCADNYGNTQKKNVSNGQAVFTDLVPNTMYKIEVSIEGFHELVGQTSEIFTTETSTNILSFHAITGAEDGSAILNFTVDGEEPAQWKLHYSTEGEEERTETFEGHSITISGLTVGKIYTFTLDAGSDLSLSGKTVLEFMSARLILAENLTVTTTNGNDMTIHWTTPGDTVIESWNVRCYNDFGYEENMTVTETEVYLTGIDPSVGYNVEVTAAGMTQPARTSITANPLNVTALNVDASAADELAVSWEFSGTTPEEGWLLMYSIDGDPDLNIIKCAGPSATVSPKLPEATYQFTIQSVDGTSIFGNVHSYECPAAEPFAENGLTADAIQINTVKTPEDKEWRFDSMGSGTFTDQFALGEGISLVLQAANDFYLPGSELQIMYVIQDAHGNVLPDYISEEKTTWKKIWLGGDYHYAELDIPVIPDRAGTYTLDLYFNGTSVGETTFTITE